MADFQQKDNSGVLFKNNKKTKDTHPDYQGNCMVNGEKLSISAWIKDGKAGKFMSLAFSPPWNQESAPSQPKPQSNVPAEFEDMEDDIPF